MILATTPLVSQSDVFPELRVRLGESSREELILAEVVDETVWLQTPGGVGEVVLPLAEVRDLIFVLPSAYHEAQKLALQGQREEALALLKDFAPRLAGFVAVPGGNARAVVASYFALLIKADRLDEGVELARRCRVTGPALMLLPYVQQLAQRLQAAGRAAEGAMVLRRLLNDAEAAVVAPFVDAFAEDLRRAGQHADALMLHECLKPLDHPAQRYRRALLLAYCDWHLDRRERASERLDALTEPAAATDLPLYCLLTGLVQLERGLVRAALDAFSRGLIQAHGASEWRPELLAAIATAYQRADYPQLAAMIEADLRLLYPQRIGRAQ